MCSTSTQIKYLQRTSWNRVGFTATFRNKVWLNIYCTSRQPAHWDCEATTRSKCGTEDWSGSCESPFSLILIATAGPCVLQVHTSVMNLSVLTSVTHMTTQTRSDINRRLHLVGEIWNERETDLFKEAKTCLMLRHELNSKQHISKRVSGYEKRMLFI